MPTSALTSIEFASVGEVGGDDILMEPDKINHHHNKNDNEDTWFDEESPEVILINKDDNKKKKISSKPKKYKVRDYQVCIPGHEKVASCRSNPDQQRCDDGSYPISRQILDLKGRLVYQYSYCPGDPPKFDIPEENLIRQIKIDINKFRSFPIKGSTIQSAPNKFSLRNGHTHFWASKETQEFKSNLSGSNVRIKAIPIQWNWNYGDGSKRNLNFPGEAMPGHTLHDETPTSHSYSETGKFGVNVTTLYRGEFSVDGGPWQAIPGQAAVPSNTLPMDVWRTEKELIAND
ncbi:hypothetical protein NMP99_10070 [Glutamicibacter mishrai]|uniref:hypothetical protein n=1 Tax=Glutamicibacter mishrai TaxID=1775880 RepID=UPI001268CFB8|nr:hypothetical protein [Glutamicibacter mishrai]UTT38403.1 hypothetical protein NMP99_10070 [Glutamicibacter mishrai]